MLPHLCECKRYPRFTSHQDAASSYVVWVFHDSKEEVVFLRSSVLHNLQYNGKTFGEWLACKDHTECCRMISRNLMKAIRSKPDYVVIVSDQEVDDAHVLCCQQCMGEMLALVADAESVHHVRKVVDDTGRNTIGQTLTVLFQRLADKNFLVARAQTLKKDMSAAVTDATTQVS
jgi:hypothetical protein